MSIILTSKLRLIREKLYAHYCPGCKQMHVIPVHGVNAEDTSITSRWTINDDITSPTFSPSIRISATGDFEDDGVISTKTICHYYIQDGNLMYLGDSDHEFAGKTILMPDFPIR